jgi:Domain of unknown function (DUF4381)
MATDPASLDNLRNIVLPPAVPWLPPAAGWRLLAAAVGAAALVALFRAFQRWRSNAYRREALRALDGVEARLRAGEPPAGAAAEISTLLKRAALAAFPREGVADLTGDRWTDFLDRTGRTQDFSQGGAKDLWLLACGASVRPPDMSGVTDAARRWLRRHRAAEPAAEAR